MNELALLIIIKLYIFVCEFLAGAIRLYGSLVSTFYGTPVLDQRTFDTFFATENVPWSIDWYGKEDCRLYTQDVVGPPEIHENVDDSIRKKAGNFELPVFMAKQVNRFFNGRIWKKIQVFPVFGN